MSARSSNDIQANFGGNLDPPDTTASDIKPSDPEAPYIFKHKPKVEGDPWEIILKPELEADTARCNVWKEEVQNLLIFAGLFSAVVTAFVIESYKFLQPDPNAAVIGLLFHIATSINNSAPFPPSIDLASINAPFTQTPSSVRINVFWFSSLILSLTTVLIGTIALQWLREHQFYPNHFSPQEKVAILHMRLQAFDAWYVPQIFAGLPLLLQGALVLFLAGMIDFALPLGARLAVPVAAIVGVTLLFLGTTTVLPTFQSLSFFVRDIIYPRTSVPTPCAYKSPQSQACRVLVALFITGFFHLFPRFSYQKAKQQWEEDENPLPNSLRHLAPSIYLIWDPQNWKSWPIFDREWVSLRDACHQHIYDKDPTLYYHRQAWTTEFPLSDVTQVLFKAVKETPSAKHTNEFLVAAIHCFEQLSKSVWTNKETQWVDEEQRHRLNNYFEQLLSHSSCSLLKWLIHCGVYKYAQVDSMALDDYISDTKSLLFHQDQMVYFLGLLLDTYSSSNLAQYQIELWTQIIRHSYIPPLTPVHDLSFCTPTILKQNSQAIPIQFIENHYQKYSSVVGMICAVFHSAALHHISEDQSLHALCTHSNMAEICCDLTSWTNDYVQWADQLGTADTYGQQQLQEIDAQYASIFKFVAAYLKKEMSNSASHPRENTPSVLFYLASISIWELFCWNSAWTVLNNSSSQFSFKLGLGSLLEALLQYRAWTSGQKNNVLEERFQIEAYPYWKGTAMVRFSDEWWDYLFKHGREIVLEAANPGPALIEGNGLDACHDPSSQGADSPGNTSNIVAVLPLTPVPASADHEALDTSAPGSDHGDPELNAQVEPHPASPTRPVPTSDNHNEARRQQMVGVSDEDSPAIDNCDTTMNGQPDSNNSPPRSNSRASIGEPNKSRELGGNYAATESTTPESPPVLPASDVVGPASPQDIISTVHVDGQSNTQAEEPHLAIEVGSPVEAEGTAVVESTASDGGLPQASELHTAIEVRQPGGNKHGESAGFGGALLEDETGAEDVVVEGTAK